MSKRSPLSTSRHATRISGGFTLTEMVAVIAIAAILMVMAVPGMSTMVKDNRRATELNSFVTSLTLARSEAIKRGTMVTACESTDGATCAATGAWENGWIVFVNLDGDDPPVVDGGETILRVSDGISGTLTLRGSGDYLNAITYRSRGFARSPTAASTGGMFTLCDDRGNTTARAVIISNTGRSRLSIDTDNDGIEEDAANNDLTCPI